MGELYEPQEIMSKQIKSKKRVSEHGEVFTNEREVNAMLDLVKDETLRIDSKFLDIKSTSLIQSHYRNSCKNVA